MVFSLNFSKNLAYLIGVTILNLKYTLFKEKLINKKIKNRCQILKMLILLKKY